MNSAERLLNAAIQSGDVRELQALVGHLPGDLLNALAGLLHSGGSAHVWSVLAAGLADMGLPGAAPACLTRAAVLAPAAADRAAILRDRAVRRAALGDEDGAELDFCMADRLAGGSDRGEPLAEQQDGALRSVSAQASPAEFVRLRDAVINHPLRDDPLRDPWEHKPLRLAKLDPITGGAWDRSFLILHDDIAVLQVECAIEGDGPLACLQNALTFTSLAAAPPAACGLAIDRLRLIARREGAPFILVEANESSPPPVKAWLDKRGGARRRLDWAWIDLTRDEAAIMADFRQTHRQQVRWGLRHMEMIDQSTTSAPSLYERYAGLCSECGRHAPPFDELAPRLADGRAGLSLGALDGNVVCGQIVTHHGATAYYSAGAALRCGNRPLAHALLMHGIRRAKQAGAQRFHLGALHVDDAFADKLRNIALFKRGFTKTFEKVEWVAVQPGD